MVGHEQLFGSNKYAPERREFHESETKAPELNIAADCANDNRRFTLDKNRKIVRGIQMLANARITHWYTLDADDWLRTDFVQTIPSQGCQTGVIIIGSYVVYRSKDRYVRCNQLARYRGSASTLAKDQLTIPTSLHGSEIEAVPRFRKAHMSVHVYFTNEPKLNFDAARSTVTSYVLVHCNTWSEGYRGSLISRLKATVKPLRRDRQTPNDFPPPFGVPNSASQREPNASRSRFPC